MLLCYEPLVGFINEVYEVHNLGAAGDKDEIV